MKVIVPSEASRYAPDGAYIDTLQVRSYEVGSNGMVTPATILRYLEQLATSASSALGFSHQWYEEHATAWFVREMTLLLGDLPGIEERIGMATWVSDARRVQAQREYALWNEGAARMVARARARWAFVDVERGLPHRIDEELAARMPVIPIAMRSRRIPLNGAETQERHTMRLTARSYEVDVQQHINNCVYVDWLNEALQRTLSSRHDIETQTLRARYYHIEYEKPTMPGDAIRIETALMRRGSRGLAVWQEIYNERENARALSAYSEHLLPGQPA